MIRVAIGPALPITQRHGAEESVRRIEIAGAAAAIPSIPATAAIDLL
jgi:hypothetical protein